MSAWPSDWLSIVADVTGVIGFFITIYVAWIARHIRRELGQRIVFPDIVEALAEIGDLLIPYQNPAIPRGPEVGKLLGKLEGKLNTLNSYTDRDSAPSVKITLAKVALYKRTSNQSDFDDMNQDLYRLVEELRGQIRRS